MKIIDTVFNAQGNGTHFEIGTDNGKYLTRETTHYLRYEKQGTHECTAFPWQNIRAVVRKEIE